MYGSIGFVILLAVFLILCFAILLLIWNTNYPLPGHFQISGRDGSGNWKKDRVGSGTGIPSDPGEETPSAQSISSSNTFFSSHCSWTANQFGDFSTLCYRKRKEVLGGLKSVEAQSLVQFWTIILGTTITQGTGPPLDPCALHVCVCFDTIATCVWYMYVHVSSTCCAKYATCAHQLSNNNYMFVRPANNQM